MENPQATSGARAPPSAVQGCFLGEAGLAPNWIRTPWECRGTPFYIGQPLPHSTATPS